MKDNMHYYQVFLPMGDQGATSSSRGFPFMNFECGIDQLDDLADELNEGRLVIGNQLFTAGTGSPGEVLITGRRRMAITGAGVVRILHASVLFKED